MPAAITFDTLKFSKKLIDAGVSPQQAEAQTEAQAEIFADMVENNLVTKQDLKEVKQELKQEIAGVRQEVDVKLAELKTDMIKWMLSITLAVSAAQGGIILSVMKFFH